MIFPFVPRLGGSTGLSVLWDTVELEVCSSIIFNHMLMIHDRFIKTNEEFHLSNIYAPCENNAKQLIWESLSGPLHLFGGKKVYVFGDFIDVRCESIYRCVAENLPGIRAMVSQ